MAILVKGPYSRKDYIDNIQNLENQQDDIDARIKRINNTTIMITLVVALLYCIGAVIFAWINRNEITDTTQLTMIVGFVSTFIIAMTLYFIAVRPYRKQIAQLFEESEQLEKHYRDNIVEAPLSEYIDKIEVQGDKVTFPPLNELDERYLYDKWSYDLADEDHSTRQIMRIYEDFYEKDRLYTKYSYMWMSITREECLMLKAKSRRG